MLETKHRVEVLVERRFEAAHVLPKHQGKCSRLHGHSWVLRVGAAGPVDENTGFVVDFAHLKKMIDTRIIEEVDHRFLGGGFVDIYNPQTQLTNTDSPPFGEDFYPSSENLVLLFRDILDSAWEEFMPSDVVLTRIELEETCTSRAVWRNPNVNLNF
jgi:6-pyruvoyl tetrahydropterin synthase/QueD family protein